MKNNYVKRVVQLLQAQRTLSNLLVCIGCDEIYQQQKRWYINELHFLESHAPHRMGVLG